MRRLRLCNSAKEPSIGMLRIVRVMDLLFLGSDTLLKMTIENVGIHKAEFGKLRYLRTQRAAHL